MTYILRHENRPQKDSKHEPVILEVYMIHNEESGM